MIQRFKDWLEARRKARLQRDFDRGYKWARDSIIDGMSPKQIEDKIMFDGSQFDRGAFYYLFDYNRGKAK